MPKTNIDPSVLDDRNPSGIGITPVVRVPRLNKSGLLAVAAVLLSAAIIATLTFNGKPLTPVSEPVKAHDAKPVAGWWDEVPDENPPELQSSAAQSPTLPPASAPQAVVPQLPPTAAPATVQPPRDPIEDMRKQQAAQALTAQLAAGGFGAGMIETDRSRSDESARTTSPATTLADHLKDYLKFQPQGETDQNRQKEKEEFLKRAHRASDPDYHSEPLRKPISPQFEVKAGTIIPAVLIGGMNSDLPGQVLAQVRENVRDTATGNHILIPQGSKLVGIYDSNVTYGQERLIVAWNRIIYPDGSSLNLKGMPGVDQAGYAGLSDEVDNHYLRIFGSAILMSAISAGVQLSQPNSGTTIFGGLQTPSAAQVASGALGQQIGQTSMHMLQKNLNIQPTITVRNGEPFNIFVTADLLLPQNINRQ
jgi:type IV secretory pathway VirB10-like protein